MAIKKIRLPWGPLTLIILGIAICYLNYQPGTWLTGWDNLHPEFNFNLNLKRTLFAVWQEYQGLGLLGGMAHAADLPRVIFLYCLYLLGIPNHFLRYLWAFIMLIVGPLGVYSFIKHHFLSSYHQSQPLFDRRTKNSAAFLGGLFYLLNLSTVQTFFTAFETFTSFYGFFPWLIYLSVNYLKKPSRRHFLFLMIISFLSSPSYYVETLFVVFCIALLPIIIGHFHSQQKLKNKFFNICRLVLGIFLSNAFWLLPVIFFVLTNGKVGTTSRINLISTPETYDRNLAFANLKSLAFLKGFWFAYSDVGLDGNWGLLMSSWDNHLKNLVVQILGYLIFSIIIVGIYYSLKKHLNHSKAILAILLICFFFLLGGGLLVNKELPLLAELFRSPFTKFSIPTSFVYSLFFAVGCIFILDLFSFLHTHLTYPATIFSIGFSLIIFTAPVFQGQLISPAIRQSIPKEYFEIFDFFKNQNPNTRIANFPQHTFWGWNFYRWGYRGSGFLWYGIRQPILDRAFDVWEHSSEKYYEDISTALYSEDQKQFESLIDQYSINWILVDKFVYAPGQSVDLFENKLENLLGASSKFKLEKNVNNKILIYKVISDNNTQNFINLTPVNYTNDKPIYTPNLRPQLDWQIETNQITIPLSNLPTAQSLTLPSYTDTENLLPVSISYKKYVGQLEIKINPLLPELKTDSQTYTPFATPNYINFSLPEDEETGFILKIDNQYFELQPPTEVSSQNEFFFLTTTYLPTQKSIGFTLYSNTQEQPLNLLPFLEQISPQNCYSQNNQTNPNQIEKILGRDSITLIGTNTVGCLSYQLPSTNSLISVTFEYSSPTNTIGQATISDQGQNIFSSQISANKNNPHHLNRVFSPGSLNSNLQLNLILEADKTKNPQEITYYNIRLNTHPLIANQTINLNSIPSLTINSPDTTNLRFVVPLIQSPFTYQFTPENNLLFPEAKNCSGNSNGIFDKTITSENITYFAQNAISCDFANLPNLPHQTAYALITTYQYYSGLPLNICLENYDSKRCDINERLAKTDSPSTQTLIEPIINPNGAGYTLHLINDSFSQQETKNSFGNIILTPIPLNFLKTITSSASLPANNPLTVDYLYSSHPVEFLYTLSVKNSNDLNINLYQTFSPLWVTLDIPEDFDLLPLWQQIIDIPKIIYQNPHFLDSNRINQWYNSWSINPGNHRLAIIYLPQYLEFLGFSLLLFLLPIYLLHSPLNQKHRIKHINLFKRKNQKPH